VNKYTTPNKNLGQTDKHLPPSTWPIFKKSRHLGISVFTDI
jgi:hypothetical protein